MRGPILEALGDRTHSIILDGELIVWNETKQMYTPFGNLKTVALEAAEAAAVARGEDPRKGKKTKRVKNQFLQADPGDHQVICYIIFDILFHNGSILIDIPLDERADYLERRVRITEIPHRVELAQVWRLFCRAAAACACVCLHLCVMSFAVLWSVASTSLLRTTFIR